MPILEYFCSRCEITIEIIQRSVPDEATCPQCGLRAERVVSSFSAKTSSDGGGCAPAGGFG